MAAELTKRFYQDRTDKKSKRKNSVEMERMKCQKKKVMNKAKLKKGDSLEDSAESWIK